MAFGLALAGGGARGAAHVGVLMALEEEGLRPASIAGTSAGSIVAALYACGMAPQELYELVVSLERKGILLLDVDLKGLITMALQFILREEIEYSGFLKGNKLEKLLEIKTGQKNISDIEMELVIPAVDINCGQTIVFVNKAEDKPQLEDITWVDNVQLSAAVRASISVPAVFKPKQLFSFCLVDGGVTDNLPVNLLYQTGYKHILSVDISRSYHMPHTGNILEVASHSLDIMQDKLKEHQEHLDSYCIHPVLPDDAGLLTFSRMKDCITAGYQSAKKNMKEIKKSILFKSEQVSCFTCKKQSLRQIASECRER